MKLKGTTMTVQSKCRYPVAGSHVKPQKDSEEEAYLGALLNAAKGLAIIATDIRGFILFATEGAERLFGRTLDELIGSDLLALFDDENLRRYLMWQISNQRTLCSRRSNIVSADCPTRHVEVTLQSVLSSQSKPFGFICVVNDLSKTLAKRGPYFMYWP
jgi:PAS domain S-box-containing protein